MGVPEDERAKFHDGNEPRKVQDFVIRIPAIEDSGKVEKLCPLIYFGPESFFQSLFGISEGRHLLYQVQVGEHTDDLWETVGLQHIEEFKRFLGGISVTSCRNPPRDLNTHHFEPKRCVHQ